MVDETKGNIYVTDTADRMSMYECVEYTDDNGKCRFLDWFHKLDPMAAAKIDRAVRNMEAGNFSHAKSVGNGISEYRIHAGPGYRIYFGSEGSRLVILLAAGIKRDQKKDIKQAKKDWQEYKQNRG